MRSTPGNLEIFNIEIVECLINFAFPRAKLVEYIASILKVYALSISTLKISRFPWVLQKEIMHETLTVNTFYNLNKLLQFAKAFQILKILMAITFVCLNDSS